MDRDCNTCQHHVQADVPNEMCQVCLDATICKLVYLPLWEPHKEQQMSKAYDAAFREPSALEAQVGGSHYKEMVIQPIEFAIANKLDFFQLNVIKYITRNKANRIEDLNKAKHYLEMYIEAVKDGF